MSLITELERLADALDDGTKEAETVGWSSVAERIGKNLGGKTDEVGILGLSTKWRHLHFLAPEALKNVGFIPLTSNSALAARTARESLQTSRKASATCVERMNSSPCNNRRSGITAIRSPNSANRFPAIPFSRFFARARPENDCYKPGNALTLQNLLVTFPQR